MKKNFEPQIIFIYNSHGQIKKTIFLTYDKDNLKQSKQYELYSYYKKDTNIFLNDDYEVIKNHILLTLNLAEIRGYIQHILKINLKILVFSLWNNVDYINNDESVFNPFENNKSFEKVLDSTIIYEIYKQVITNTIFCVIDEENYSNNALCSDGIYEEKMYLFVDSIMNYDLEDNEIIIYGSENNKYTFNINWYNNMLNKIKNLVNYKKEIAEYYFDNIHLSGSNLILKEDIDYKILLKKISYNNIDIYKTDDALDNILSIRDDIMVINNISEYSNIILEQPKIEDMVIRQKNIKKVIKIDFNLTINNNLIIDFETNFFIILTKKTKNIFLDRTKKINIITSSNHISFFSYNINYDLCVYITKFIIGIQLLKHNVKFTILDKKMGNRYYSRYCQSIRKPTILKEFIYDEDIYKNYNNIYFEHKFNKGDVYYNAQNDNYVICNNENLYNLGFISDLYKGYNVCVPCCYKKIKKETEIFKNCIYNNTEEENPEPYLHIFKYYRVIISQNKIGNLLLKLFNLFNYKTQISYYNKNKPTKISFSKLINTVNFLKKLDYKQINNTTVFINQLLETEDKTIDLSEHLSFLDQYIVINKYRKILSAKNYTIYTSNKTKKDITNISDLRNNKEIEIYFHQDTLYFNPEILQLYIINKEKFLQEVKFFLIIQNKIHDLKVINKTHSESYINIQEIPIDIKKRIIEKYININEFNFFYNYDTSNYQNTNSKSLITKSHHVRTTENNISNNLGSKYDFENYKDLDIAYINKNIYFKGEIETLHCDTKYIYTVDTYNLNEESLGYYITNVLYKPYFDMYYNFSEEEFILFQKTFLNNLSNLINFYNFNKILNLKQDKTVIFNIIKVLNKNFVEKKALLILK